MILPEKLTFHFRDNLGNIISNLIVYFELPVKKKNSYSIGPLKTDKKGIIKLSKNDILLNVNDSLKDYPMDYSTSVEGLSNSIVINIYSIEELTNMSAAVAKFYPETSKKLNNLLKKCSNSIISSKTVIDIIVDSDPIIVSLAKQHLLR
jgi:hypothetical protein